MNIIHRFIWEVAFSQYFMKNFSWSSVVIELIVRLLRTISSSFFNMVLLLIFKRTLLPYTSNVKKSAIWPLFDSVADLQKWEYAPIAPPKIFLTWNCFIIFVMVWWLLSKNIYCFGIPPHSFLDRHFCLFKLDRSLMKDVFDRQYLNRVLIFDENLNDKIESYWVEDCQYMHCDEKTRKWISLFTHRLITLSQYLSNNTVAGEFLDAYCHPPTL
jgi:hypothetical protein